MQLFFMADPAHVLKNICAQLFRMKTFTLGNEAAKDHNLPSGIVSVEHVEAVIEYDNKNDLKIANRLSEIHICTGHFTKMKANVAVQMFCEAVPAISCLIYQGVLPPVAEATAWFFSLVFK